MQDGEVFGMNENDTNDYTGDTAGIITIDGVSTVIAWNKMLR